MANPLPYHRGPGASVLCDDSKCRAAGDSDNYYFVATSVEAAERAVAALNATHNIPMELLSSMEFACTLQSVFGGDEAHDAIRALKEMNNAVCDVRLV